MIESIIYELFSTEGFPPRWECGDWPEHIGWMHIVFNMYMMTLYWSLALVIAVIARPFNKTLAFIGLFLLFCGGSHLVWTVGFYVPVYRPDAYIVLPIQCVVTTVALLRVVLIELPKWASPELRKQLDALADSADPFMFLNLNHRCTFVNQGFCEMVSVSKNQILQNAKQIFKDDVLREMSGQVQLGRTFSKRINIINGDDVEFPVDCRCIPVYMQNGGIIGARIEIKHIQND